MCHQNATRFYGRIAYDDDTTEAFQGLALSGSEGARMVRALGDSSALLLKSHGPLVTGASVAEAFDDLYYLERAAQNQVLAASMNQMLAEIDHDTANRTAADFRHYAPAAARAHLDALQRILDREDPSWRR
jgi:ribulose-5-phosphate 4-epimerase/fuculose-1-phosphate aldolase